MDRKELEQLLKQCDYHANSDKPHGQILSAFDQKQQEIERLKREVIFASDKYTTLQSDNERLREALNEIETEATRILSLKNQRIARSALNRKQEPNK